MSRSSVQRPAQYTAPTGLVTFLFSDIEGSSKRWETRREAMQRALTRHDRILRTSIESHNGRVFKTMGDQFCSVFWSSHEALAAAHHAQRSLAAADWTAVDGLRVRMAVHTGVTDERDGDYFGPAINRVARLLGIGHGGQVLVSGFVAEMVNTQLPKNTTLRDLGSYRLKDLAHPERVYQLVAEDAEQAFPNLRPLGSPRNLPEQLTTFLGRETDVATLARLTEESRLVTLAGTGGVGKTRTALQVAATLVDDFEDGAWFVDLAPLSDPQLVPSAIASVFHIEDRSGSKSPLENFITLFRDKRALIILDNCEHVISAAAEVVDAILRGCPHVRMLATSRESLHVAGEVLYRLPALPVPPAGQISASDAAMHAAVRLFVERAQLVDHKFAITDANAAFVTEIVRRLDGIALAIELAAAQVKALTLDQLAARLDERFDVLAGGGRTALPRQQTLRALIEWSYDLLDEPERRLLRALSIFRDGWTLEAAQKVCAGDSASDIPAMHSRLVDKSLVVAELNSETPRYRLLESTHEFALARLRERELAKVAACHSAYYCELSSRIADDFWKVNEDRCLAALSDDLENYRAAIEWALTNRNDIRTGALIVANLGPLWSDRLYREGNALVELALSALPSAEPLIHARLLMVHAHFRYDGGRGLAAATQAVALLRADGSDRERLADALRILGNSVGRLGRMPEAIEHLQEAIQISRQLKLPRFTASILGWLGFGFVATGQRARSRAAFDEAIALAGNAGDPVRMPLVNFAELQFAEGDIRGAVASARAALGILRDTGTNSQALIGNCNLAAYYAELGELHDAWKHASLGLEIAVQLERAMPTAIAMEHLVQVAARCGETERAATLIGYIDSVYAKEKHPREPTERSGNERILAILRTAYSPQRLEALKAQGSALGQAAAIALATTPLKLPNRASLWPASQ